MIGSDKIFHRVILVVLIAITGIFLIGTAFIIFEINTSTLQSRYYVKKSNDLTFTTVPGKSNRIVFPKRGPHNERRGYTDLPLMISSLEKQGFSIDSQALISHGMSQLPVNGLPLIFSEQKQAGLIILGAYGDTLYTSIYPNPVYTSFDSIPPLIVETLLFIEDRNLLDPSNSKKNPSLAFSRLFVSTWHLLLSKAGLRRNVPGASTLATQTEKFKYWPEGRTISIEDKLLQMQAASFRAYRNGSNTLNARKEIVLEHINSAPFSAYPNYGEVNGIGEAMNVWYGVPLDSVNRYLRNPELDIKKAGLYYRMVLSLQIAHRRPSYFLLTATDALHRKTGVYLELLSKSGVLPDSIYTEAKKSKPSIAKPGTSYINSEITRKKAANPIRIPLLSMFGINQLYRLDRLHCTVKTTIDARSTITLTDFLRRLKDQHLLDSLKLRDFRMLQKGDIEKVIYSFCLYERVGSRNVLRIQADSKDNPLNINDGVKLDLGSTAKLRTLITYLEVIEELYTLYSSDKGLLLSENSSNLPDSLSLWVRGMFQENSTISLEAILDSAMMRSYPANPGEKFFTGGGIHQFANFDDKHDNQRISVKEAFRHSVNLVFIRMMRDICDYYSNKHLDQLAILDTAGTADDKLLSRFIEHESTRFLGRFHRSLKNIPGDSLTDALIAGIKPSPAKIAAIYCGINSSPSYDGLRYYLLKYSTNNSDSISTTKLLKRYTSRSLTLSDKAFVASVHPLKLWTAAYLSENPGASMNQLKNDSRQFLGEAYRWLYKTERTGMRESRILQARELEAFSFIHEAWSKLGYPFQELVPSLATSIGASADRPSALAELAGIIQNDGLRYPTSRIDTISLAEGTPYYTRMHHDGTNEAIRCLSKQVARCIRNSLYDVVENGTGQRIRQPGINLRIGGKTGTGDHRAKRVSKGGTVIGEKVMNRTATFVFIIGDRFFGTVSAFVAGEDAKGYNFTSALPVHILKAMVPLLQDILTKTTAVSVNDIPFPSDNDSAIKTDSESYDSGSESLQNIF